MNANDLQLGERYRIKDTVQAKVCERPMEYIGAEQYHGVTYHVFWDAKMGLGHWITPQEVEPA